MFSKYFNLFLVVSLAGHVSLFTVFNPSAVLPVKEKHPPVVRFYVVNADKEEIILDKNRNKIFTKVLGALDKAFYSIPSAAGFSRRYLSAPSTIHEPLKTSDGTNLSLIMRAEKKMASEDEIFLSAVSDQNSYYERQKFDSMVSAFVKKEKDEYTVKPEKTAKPPEQISVRIEWGGNPRKIFAKEMPILSKEKKILDVTSEGTQRVLRDNVRLKFWIDVNGVVKFVMLERSSGLARYDNICLNSLKMWRFNPADGNRMLEFGTITFVFQ